MIMPGTFGGGGTGCPSGPPRLTEYEMKLFDALVGRGHVVRRLGACRVTDHRHLVAVDEPLQGRTGTIVLGEREVERLRRAPACRVSFFLMFLAAVPSRPSRDRSTWSGATTTNPQPRKVGREVDRLLRKAGVAVAEQHDRERAAGCRRGARMRVDRVLRSSSAAPPGPSPAMPATACLARSKLSFGSPAHRCGGWIPDHDPPAVRECGGHRAGLERTVLGVVGHLRRGGRAARRRSSCPNCTPSPPSRRPAGPTRDASAALPRCAAADGQWRIATSCLLPASVSAHRDSSDEPRFTRMSARSAYISSRDEISGDPRCRWCGRRFEVARRTGPSTGVLPARLSSAGPHRPQVGGRPRPRRRRRHRRPSMRSKSSRARCTACRRRSRTSIRISSTPTARTTCAPHCAGCSTTPGRWPRPGSSHEGGLSSLDISQRLAGVRPVCGQGCHLT